MVEVELDQLKPQAPPAAEWAPAHDSLIARHGFVILPEPTDSPVVQHYIADHLAFYGYPPDVGTVSAFWLAICRDGHVWGVVGLRPLNPKSVEVPDFYLHRSRWGILAGYAALEYLKSYAEECQVEILTMTPSWNKPQMKALERVFDVPGPALMLYRYRPWEKQNG